MRASLHRLRPSRRVGLAVVVLRLLLGFAFLPAGLKKVLGERFTDPANHGPFHDFLHAFYATGPFYRFVGAVQLLAAVLLLTQRFALLGALLALPLFTAILVLCWSTQVFFTAAMVTLMWAGTVALLTWDGARLGPLVGRPMEVPPAPPVDEGLWGRSGLAILGIYLASCALAGGVYRPRGLDLTEPAFYVLPTVALVPIVTWLLERGRRRGGAPRTGG